MKAAIYARKSNDDPRSEDNKSVTRQIERAKAYAIAKGWSVDDELVFMDDGVSGKVFDPRKRRGLFRLLGNLKEFDVLVMSDADRLGRDQVETPMYRGKILAAGKRLFYYLKDVEYKATNPLEVLMGQIGDFNATMERLKTAERTYDALSRKAAKGHSPGGRVFGYDNVWIFKNGGEVLAPAGAKKGDPDTRTDWRKNDAEAAVVLGIFKMYDAGHGHTAIAKTLNGDQSTSQKRRVHRYMDLSQKYFAGVTPPAPQHGEQGTGSWAPSTIRAMLYRTRYAGIIPYGEYRTEEIAGVEKCTRQDKFIQVEREDLRIVPPALWDKVQTRLKNVRDNYVRENNGTLWGRPETGRESKYLLSGLARCGCKKGEHVCGANIVITGGQKLSHYYYGCGYHQKRGVRACTNDTRERMAVMDELVLNEIDTKLLNDTNREYIIEKAVADFAKALKEAPDTLPKLEAELRKTRKELGRFMEAIAGGKVPKSIMAEIANRERRIEQLEREIGRYSVPDVGELGMRRARKGAREMAGRFKDLIRGDVPRARQALRKLLRDRDGNFSPLMFIPIMQNGRKTYRITGAANLAPLYNVGTEERT